MVVSAVRGPGVNQMLDDEDSGRNVDAIYRRHLVLVRGRALRILGNRALAEEVAQEAFIRFIGRRCRLGEEDNPAGMLVRIVTNLALNMLRDAKRRRELLEESGPDPEAGRPGGLAPEELLLLRQVLARVPQREARVASYYYLDGMEHEEIAALLGTHRRAVGRTLDKFRARATRLLANGKERAAS